MLASMFRSDVSDVKFVLDEGFLYNSTVYTSLYTFVLAKTLAKTLGFSRGTFCRACAF